MFLLFLIITYYRRLSEPHKKIRTSPLNNEIILNNEIVINNEIIINNEIVI
jgi:hypothetical protein